MVFKVKLTNQARYGVVPHCGTIAAGDTFELKIVLQDEACLDLHSADSKGSKDMFLIQAAWQPVLVGQPNPTADEFWAENREHHKTAEGKATLSVVKFSS